MTEWPTVGASIVVAVITAVTTDRRLIRQLRADGTRQELELSAQSERQDRALVAEASRGT
jgi:hypothetical protein